MNNSNDEKPSFVKVAACLYRHSRTAIYYGLVKRSGKQFRMSFKTRDRKLAERLLADYRQKAGRLGRRTAVGKLTFAELSDSWFAIEKPKLKPASASRLDVSTSSNSVNN